jgi:tRNA (mo5U34)-methyltransferase
VGPLSNTVIKDKIDSFPRWHYQFDLRGSLTPIRPPERANAHEQRRRYFMEPLSELYGGSLKGKRVLDLGCNAGFWSLDALERGADFVLGLDGRRMHIDQANFVFEVKEIDKDRYDFREANVFDFAYEEFGDFDIVLCLGLVYHLNKPVELMETIARVNSDVVVIDTLLSVAPGSYLRVRSEDIENPLHAMDKELVMSPTRQAMVDLATAMGYEVAILKPRFTDYSGARNYRQGRRRAFICAKRTPLDRLRVPTEPTSTLGHLGDYAWLARDVVPRLPARLRKKAARKRS